MTINVEDNSVPLLGPTRVNSEKFKEELTRVYPAAGGSITQRNVKLFTDFELVFMSHSGFKQGKLHPTDEKNI